MSGHSKWANIKRKKEVNDKAKSNAFSKLSRLITLAVIEGGKINDPNNNVKLRLAIDKAKTYNMPKSNIERAIEKAMGDASTSLREVIYEGFGPKGAGLILQATTDNPNRTSSEIRNTLERYGGKLGAQGSVNYLFIRCGLVTVARSAGTEEQIFALGDKLGALDIDEDETHFYIYVPFEAIGKIKVVAGDVPFNAEIDYKPQTFIDLDSASLDVYHNMISALEDLDDVHRVFTNARFSTDA